MLTVFYSYAHEDETLRDELEKHLSLLKRQGVIDDWHDREITAGQHWRNQIDEHLEAAQLILLLVSADFLASDYCNDVELKRALGREKEGSARVIPIILRPADWESAAFGQLQCLPTDAVAVTQWANQDAAFTDIAKGIRKAVQALIPEAATRQSQSVKADSLTATVQPDDPISESAGQSADQVKSPPIINENKQHEAAQASPMQPFKWYWLVLVGVLGLFWVITLPFFTSAYQDHISQGRDYLHLGKFTDAQKEFQDALNLHPLYILANVVEALMNEKSGQLIKKYAKALVKNTDANIGIETTQVFDDNDLVRIEAKLKILEKAYPDDADVQMLFGRFYAGKAAFIPAETHYQKALELNKDSAEAHFGLSYVYDLQRKFKEANEHAQKAVALSDNTSRYVINWANSFAELENYHEAIKTIRKPE